MKLLQYFLLLVISCTSHIASANNILAINYTITPELTTSPPYIKVEAEIIGQMKDKIIIDLPYKWGGAHYSSQIKNVRLIQPHGSIQFKTDNVNQVIITIPTTQSISLSYEVHQKLGDPAHVHETIIRKDLIHAIGSGLLITPSSMKDTDKIKVSITWKDIPSQWKSLSSYGMDKSLSFITTKLELLHALYVVGNIRVYQISDPINPVYLSLYGNFDLQDKAMAADLGGIIKSQRSFFNDHDFPFYAISLIEGDDPTSMGGTKIHNSFTAYIPKGMDKICSYILIAHEHLHNWIGVKIANNEKDEELNYWWSEGFTEYYTRVLALRSGGISLEEFIDECNQFFKNYYFSPVLNEPNDRIKRDFWNDKHIEKLPYYRGFVFALYLDNKIKANNPNNSLDQVMQDLFKASAQQSFSIQHFKNIIKTYIPEGIDKEILLYIDQGKTIELNELMKVLPIEKVKMGIYERGFDRDAFWDEKIIKSIDKNSNAYKVGLRDGDQVIKYNFQKGQDPDQIITIETTRGIFKYRPENRDKLDIYQFKSNLSKEDRLEIEKFFGIK